MQTAHVTESLSAYLDGQVGTDERTKIAAHLEVCDACRTHLEALRKTVALLHGAEPVRAPEGFRAQVRAQIEGQRARRMIRRPRWAWSWRIAGATVAVALIGLFVANVLREQVPPTSALQERGVSEVTAVPPSTSAGGAMDRTPRATPGRAGPQAGAPPIIGAPVVPALRRVIRTAMVSLDVDNLDETASRLTRIAEAAGGFIADSSTARAGATPEGMFVLRVPAPEFAGVLSQVEGLGRVQQRRLGGQDVTEEYIDLQARIRNLERYEQRLLAFVDRATRVSDLLAVEQELARVRGEIEMLTGRARYLDRQVDLATIQVSAREKAKPASSLWNFDDTLAKIDSAFLATIRQLLRAAEAVVVALSALAPVLILVAIIWLLVRRVRLAREA